MSKDNIPEPMRQRLLELERIKADADVEIQEIHSAAAVLARYSGGVMTVGQPVGQPHSAYSAAQQLSGMSKHQQVIGSAVKALKGRSLHTDQLLMVLEDMGVTIGGSNPSANLSAYLSKEKHLFQASRRDGWSLKEGAEQLEIIPSWLRSSSK